MFGAEVDPAHGMICDAEIEEDGLRRVVVAQDDVVRFDISMNDISSVDHSKRLK